MEKTISIFHTSFYIPAIQKLAFHIPNVQILCTYHFDDSLRTLFKRCELFKDVLYCRDYSERMFASFAHQTQS